MKKTPVAIVVLACALAFLGVWRKDLDPLDAMALVGSAVTVGAGVHFKSKRRGKAKPNPANGSKP